jgi:hypothetical protein
MWFSISKSTLKFQLKFHIHFDLFSAHSHSKEFRVVSVVIRGAHARITFLIQRKTINLSNNNDISLNQNLSNSEATTPLNDGEVYVLILFSSLL